MHITEPSISETSIYEKRQQAQRIFQAGINAADPAVAVKKHLRNDQGMLSIVLDQADPAKIRTKDWSNIYLIAFGKAACAMMEAAQEIIPAQSLSSQCIAVTNYENKTPIINTLVLAANHPLPDKNGLKAAHTITNLVQQADKSELVLFLISGGGSSLLPCPVNSLSLQDKIAVTDLLLTSGATIQQINCVRKHLSALKGGQLAKMTAPADFHALILSDVLDDDVSAIASGPTVADASTFGQAESILKSLGIWKKIPVSAAEYLTAGIAGKVAETPKSDNGLFRKTTHTLIGSNTLSLKASEKVASELGYQTHIYHQQLTGEARTVAEQLVIYSKQILAQKPIQAFAILAGGETTVTVKGNGQGGRNQEFALAFAIAAKHHNLTKNWVLLSAGTDGHDGPTDAAGGIIDPNTLCRITAQQLAPEQLLDNNDSYHALLAASDILITGATGTNVADLQILLFN